MTDLQGKIKKRISYIKREERKKFLKLKRGRKGFGKHNLKFDVGRDILQNAGGAYYVMVFAYQRKEDVMHIIAEVLL